jgi:hemerythrin-like domain-containing protein
VSVFTYLLDEHRSLLPVLAALEQAAEAKDRNALKAHFIVAWPALTKELEAQMTLEEEVAFPRISRMMGENFLKPFREEHREIRALRDLLLEQAAAGKVPVDLCLILCELIVAHIQREDLTLLPSACEVLDLTEVPAYG